jgi:hypothetical protein
MPRAWSFLTRASDFEEATEAMEEATSFGTYASLESTIKPKTSTATGIQKCASLRMAAGQLRRERFVCISGIGKQAGIV